MKVFKFTQTFTNMMIIFIPPYFRDRSTTVKLNRRSSTRTDVKASNVAGPTRQPTKVNLLYKRLRTNLNINNMF